MKKFQTRTALAASALLTWALSAQAHEAASVPANVVQLSATGQVEVAQDMLTMRLSTRREATDANTVQNQLKVALEQALALARPQARAGALEVRTGGFGLTPRYGRDGQINGWQGTAELLLEGTDIPRVTATAGQIQSLTVSQAYFGLSREATLKLETEAQAQAIERFKRKADEVSKAFGFNGYSVREVSVSSADQPAYRPAPRMMAMEAKAAVADAPVPVEAGKTAVTVMVNGAIQMK
ncbi:SIMPL domain-containing protein [Hydrogenophaga atypica]|uniref:SIMPL domain-containing protein n=1 Tax=Hydrogenophaga atypica TaxID=249409 RepID=A0ABW2QGQ6_9BURK